MKILNLYAGIGGNRKLWKKHKVTAVEHNKDIAAVYQDLYPKDKVIVGDAHSYLLKHHQDYDFIWSSPPCVSHSRIRCCAVHSGRYDAVFPQPELWQEILFLQHFAKCNWVVENVIPYYKPFIPISFMLGRHFFWSSFGCSTRHFKERNENHCKLNGKSTIYGINLDKYNIKDKRTLLRNLINPELGAYILDSSIHSRFKLL